MEEIIVLTPEQGRAIYRKDYDLKGSVFHPVLGPNMEIIISKQSVDDTKAKEFDFLKEIPPTTLEALDKSQLSEKEKLLQYEEMAKKNLKEVQDKLATVDTIDPIDTKDAEIKK